MKTSIIFLTFLFLAHMRQLYLTIPYRTLRDKSEVKHLINVQVNRYPYKIDVTFNSDADYILNLDQSSVIMQKLDRPDYRKNQQSIFGIVQFNGYEKVDQKLSITFKTAYTIYYFLRDYSPKITWINLGKTKQISYQQRPSSLQEGCFNFGPSSQQNRPIKDLKKYSKYMGERIITFRGNKNNEDGEIIFGGYPTQFIKDQAYHTTKLEYIGLAYYTMITTALQLHKQSGNNIVTLDLYKEMVRLKFSISQRTLIIPESAIQSLKRSFTQCNFEQYDEKQDKNKYFKCKGLAIDDIQLHALHFTLKGSQLPLAILFKNLILKTSNETIWFDITTGPEHSFQISEAILRQYMIGIDYRDGTLMYGILNQQSWMSKSLLMSIFLYGNIALFMVSVVLVLLQDRVKERMKIAIKQQFGFGEKDKANKVNSYQLANVNQDSFTQ